MGDKRDEFWRFLVFQVARAFFGDDGNQAQIQNLVSAALATSREEFYAQFSEPAAPGGEARDA